MATLNRPVSGESSWGEEGLEKLEKWVEVGEVVIDTGGQRYRVSGRWPCSQPLVSGRGLLMLIVLKPE